MKCHYVIDDKTGNSVMIPYCWTNLHQDDLSRCTCSFNKMPEKVSSAAKENRLIKEYADHLRKENIKLAEKVQRLQKKLCSNTD
jgi:hypothetical protein